MDGLIYEFIRRIFLSSGPSTEIQDFVSPKLNRGLEVPTYRIMCKEDN